MPLQFMVADSVLIEIDTSDDRIMRFFRFEWGGLQRLTGHPQSVLAVRFGLVEPLEIRLQSRYEVSGAKMVIMDPTNNRMLVDFSSLETNRVEIAAEPSVNLSYFLYHVIEPILHILLLRSRKTFVHSSSIAIGGHGHVFAAFPHTGKTNMVLYSVLERNAEFLSDELSIISADGLVYPYPRPVIMFGYNLGASPRLRARVMAAMSMRERAAAPLRMMFSTLSHSLETGKSTTLGLGLKMIFQRLGFRHRVPLHHGNPSPKPLDSLSILYRTNSKVYEVYPIEDIDVLVQALAANMMMERNFTKEYVYAFAFTMPPVPPPLPTWMFASQCRVLHDALGKTHVYGVRIPPSCRATDLWGLLSQEGILSPVSNKINGALRRNERCSPT
ncbi:MAG: hypothetical protein ACTSPE_08755 [Candidatus Thorarchaeota archaeon]